MITITKESKWTTYEGVTKKLCELDDLHIVNIIIHIKNNSLSYNIYFIEVLNSILKERGFLMSDRGNEPEILKLGQTPHKNKDGLWAYWDADNQKEVVLQKQINE